MIDGQKEFSRSAASLARSPLGIIALFIVLVYGLAAITLSFSGNLSADERLPLIYFMVIFPILVLAVFTWLVSHHSGKLFAPADFKNEENFLKAHQQQVAVAALVAASTKEGSDVANISAIVSSVNMATAQTATQLGGWKKQILWVDDRPENNVYERTAFEAIGFSFAISLSTQDALRQMEHRRFAAIISDMGRKKGPKAGYELLREIRKRDPKTPLFFYAGSNLPQHWEETIKNGGQGNTNDPNELFEMVTRAIVSSLEN